MKNVVDHFTSCSHNSGSLGSQIILSGEKHHGLASILSWKCIGCGHEMSFPTSTKASGTIGNHWTTNLAAVWGQMATGGGFNSLEESMSVLGIPVMSKQSFMQTEQQIGQGWWAVLQESMKAAGKEEKQHAIEQNSYHQGVPAITVIVDGGWSKRTHKHSYNALSGVGVIIGKHTGKLLYIGVRNKYCAACVNNKKTKKKTSHVCFKNWEEASASMESDIIVEGFKLAEEQHGVRYTKFIGDGDSSVLAHLREDVKVWGRDIEKQECANHAVKCFRTSLEKLAKEKPQYKGRGKLTEQMRKRLASSMRCAIINRSKLPDKGKAVQLLQKDILNCALHCFGSHTKCSADFCKVAQSSQGKEASLDVSIHQSTSDTSTTSSNPDLTTEELDCNELSLTTSLNSLSSDHECNSMLSSPDGEQSSLDLTSDRPSSSTNSDEIFLSDSSSVSSNSQPEIENDTLGEFIREQQTAWEDAISEIPTDLPKPSHPIDEQLICDIQTIASRLAAKAQQLIGKQHV